MNHNKDKLLDLKKGVTSPFKDRIYTKGASLCSRWTYKDEESCEEAMGWLETARKMALSIQDPDAEPDYDRIMTGLNNAHQLLKSHRVVSKDNSS